MKKFNDRIIPKKLRKQKQWVAWKYGPLQATGKKPKIPINPHTGGPAKINDSTTWGKFIDARQRCNDDDLDGIGFVFTENDPFCGIDLDNCINPKTGELDKFAHRIIKLLKSYTEVSPSGKGVKIITKGKLPGKGINAPTIEMYDRKRFFTITGQVLGETNVKIKDHSENIIKLYNKLSHENQNVSSSSVNAKDLLLNCGENPNQHDNKNQEARNVGLHKSQSEDDLAKVSKLLRYTGGDIQRTDKLFRKTELYRSKWDEKHSADGKTYGEMTIEKAMLNYQSEISDKVRQALDNQEQGDANLFIELNRGKFCYDHEEQRWYIFGDNYWQIDRKKEALASVHKVINFYQEELNRLTITELRKEIKDRIKALNALGRRKHILELATAGENSLGITGEEWDSKPWTMACANGILFLKGPEVKFRKGKPDDYIKTPCATEWKGIDTKAYIWKKTLKEIFQKDKKLTRHVQKLFGYALSGSCQQHIFNILNGVGRNGKSTIIETISYVLGDMATPIPVETILSQANTLSGGAPRADIMNLRGRRIAWASESDDGRRLNASQIKLLTGGDKITARSPFSKNMVTFPPTHTMFMLTNHLPHLDFNDYALWQRTHVIPFALSFINEPEQEFERKANPELKEELKKEAPGILAWLVRGCLKAQEFGLKRPAAVTRAIAEYQRKEDTISLFIKECCIMKENGRAGATELHDAYKTWCRENDLLPVSRVNFGKQLGRKFKKVQSNGIFYIGLRLRKTLD